MGSSYCLCWLAACAFKPCEITHIFLINCHKYLWEIWWRSDNHCCPAFEWRSKQNHEYLSDSYCDCAVFSISYSVCHYTQSQLQPAPILLSPFIKHNSCCSYNGFTHTRPNSSDLNWSECKIHWLFNLIILSVLKLISTCTWNKIEYSL